MVTNDLMAALGVYIDKTFLDKERCKAIIEEMHRVPKNQSTVYKTEKGSHLDTNIRKTNFSKVSKETYWSIMNSFMDLKPHLEEFFNIPLLGIEVPEFLYYSSGSFFTPHKDILAEQDNPRKISTVLFLNQQNNNNQDGGYEGGELCLYGLNEAFPNNGFAMPTSQGLLVAFRSEIMHEVKPILSGTRCSLVVWYH